MRFSFAIVAALVAAAANAVVAAPAVHADALPGTPIPDQYIVVFKKTVSADQLTAHQTLLHASLDPTRFRVQDGSEGTLADGVMDYGIRHWYDVPGLKGYSAKLPKNIVAMLKADPQIDYVEEDKVVTILASQKNPPSWGLQRISNRDLPLGQTYEYPDSAGSNVDAYIIDTGILIKHPDFDGRAKIGKTFTDDGDVDGNGHGTHVAGTIGSTSFGVAKKVNLIAVKVLDSRGSGTISGVLGGIEWVAKEAPKTGRPSCANMSLGGGKSRALDDAVKAAIKAGISFAVAAGNSAGDACKLSPANVPEAITVAASDKTDKLASFSEWGTCVDVIAPGVDITSTWNNGKTNTISGTSMASPHVCGVVALALGEGNFTSPAAVEAYIKAISSKDRITGSLRTTPNNFLYNHVKGGKLPDDEPTEPTPPAPGEPGDDPSDGDCPFPQCIFDPECSRCCIDDQCFEIPKFRFWK